MKTPIAPWTLGLAGAALLALGATAGQAADKAPAKHNDCFWTRDANGFAAQGDKILNVRVNSRDVYQFEMLGHCQDLDWNNRIALVSRPGDSICSGMDAEVVTHSPIGPQRCPVRSVRKLTPEEIAALPKKARP